MRILLTGAGGFVGQQLLAYLKQQGHFVRALVRREFKSSDIADETVIGNLTIDTPFRHCLDNMDIVIHLADGFNAFEHLPRDFRHRAAEQQLATTARLAGIAAQQGVRFIYLSTVKTMCGTHAEAVLDEKTPPRPQSLYGRLKLEAEKAILENAGRYGSKALILRFPIVFGAGPRGNMEKLLRLADTPLPLPFRGLESRRSLVSMQSLIAAVGVIVKNPDAGEGVFLVQDGSLSVEAIVRALRRGLGRPERQFFLPPALWGLAGKLPVVAAKANRFGKSLMIDDTKFRTCFHWQPEKPLLILLEEFAGNRHR